MQTPEIYEPEEKTEPMPPQFFESFQRELDKYRKHIDVLHLDTAAEQAMLELIANFSDYLTKLAADREKINARDTDREMRDWLEQQQQMDIIAGVRNPLKDERVFANYKYGMLASVFVALSEFY